MEGYGRRVQRVLAFVLVFNVAIVALKGFIGWRSGSLSVLADALHSLLDAAGNVVALVVLRAAMQPPDEDHPWGHAKYETVGAFVLAGLLFVTAWEVIQEAVGRLINPQPVHVDTLTIAMLLVSLASTTAVSFAELRASRRLRSEILRADSAHTRSDVLVEVAVVGGVLLSGRGFPVADALLAIVVAGVIAFTGYSLFARSFPVLTDHAAFQSEEIREIVEAIPGVQNVHDIRSRGRRGEAYVQMHLVVEPSDVLRAHAITEEIERELRSRLGVKEAVIHVEPFAD
jgi:cation diffusion facilitator family transporter